MDSNSWKRRGRGPSRTLMWSKIPIYQSGTLGARDFSSAVSGFCQQVPPHARKTSGTQGTNLGVYQSSILKLTKPWTPQILQECYFVHKIRLGLKSELYKAKTCIF